MTRMTLALLRRLTGFFVAGVLAILPVVVTVAVVVWVVEYLEYLCGPETFIGSNSFGINFAELGKQAGTETMLAMLQIIDHSLARMRQSTHTTVLAEMAIIRLAALEDLDNLSE